MSNKSGSAIDNAQDVIEAFGGIRPMAKKMDVAVTTVQGWKKRNTIPAARVDDVLKAAQEHEIDLSQILADAPAANENVKESEKPVAEATAEADDHEKEATETAEYIVDLKHKIEDAEKESVFDDDAEPLRVPKREQKPNSVPVGMIAGVIGLVVIVTLIIVLLQFVGGPAEREEELVIKEVVVVEEPEAKGNFLGSILPEDLNERVTALKTQAQETQQKINVAVEKTKEISNDVLAEDAGTFEERAQRLEGHLSEIPLNPEIAGFLGKISALKGEIAGQEQLQQSVLELQSVLSGVSASSTEQVNETLDAAREQSDTLGNTFENVPRGELKAAALLLGMSQLRSSLNRDNDAFDGDLDLLIKLVGEDDPALVASIEKLAPHAKEGVLTPAGLSDEFRTFAGDAVVSSLQGEDVSLQERASARMNELLQVEKDGELITGTETQVKLSTAENMLNQGDLAGAIALTQTLDGNAATAMAPWLEQANASLMAQDAKKVLGEAMNAVTAGGSSGIGGRLIQDKEAGINIYVPAQRMPTTPKSFQ